MNHSCRFSLARLVFAAIFLPLSLHSQDVKSIKILTEKVGGAEASKIVSCTLLPKNDGWFLFAIKLSEGAEVGKESGFTCRFYEGEKLIFDSSLLPVADGESLVVSLQLAEELLDKLHIGAAVTAKEEDYSLGVRVKRGADGQYHPVVLLERYIGSEIIDE